MLLVREESSWCVLSHPRSSSETTWSGTDDDDIVHVFFNIQGHISGVARAYETVLW